MKAEFHGLLSMIAAMDRCRVIGVDGELPWHLPDDMRWFRKVTLDKPVIMGRKTYESIGRPLPKRVNIVMTRDTNFAAEGCIIVHSRDAALTAAGDAEEAVVIGGEAVYRLFLPQAKRLYLTMVGAEVRGDTFFPEIDSADWRVSWQIHHPADDRHAYAFDQIVMERSMD